MLTPLTIALRQTALTVLVTSRGQERGTNMSRRKPVFLIVDTCVWLDLAKDYAQRPLLAALEELVRMRFVGLIAPEIVLDEFARNKDRVIEESGRSIAGTLKRAKELLGKHGDKSRKLEAIQQLNDLDQQAVNYRDSAEEAMVRIGALFKEAEVVKSSAEAKLRAADRALSGRAPFHRQRNGMADALLIETYADIRREKGCRFAFVSHNTKDFSAQVADERLPHPDIASYFSKDKSRYFIKLGDALNVFRPDEFADVMIEQTWFEPPRRYTDILQAISKFTDQVWYNRHQNWRIKLEEGTATLIPDNEERGRDPYGKRIHESVWRGAERAAREKELKYGIDELGPWDDFEWGMINGKLSALRWVLGEEWDMLDT